MLPCLGRLRLTPTAMLPGHGDGDEGYSSEVLHVDLPPSPKSPSPPVSPVLTRKPVSPLRREEEKRGSPLRDEGMEVEKGGERGEGGEADEDDPDDKGGEEDDDDEDKGDEEDDDDNDDPWQGARRRNLPGQQATSKDKKRKRREDAEKNDTLLKEFVAMFEDAVNNIDKMMLVGNASAERVRKEIQALVFRMAVWFSSQPGDRMRDIYGNDGALLKYRSIVNALIKRAREFNMNDEAVLLHKNLMLGILQTQSARYGMQKERARMRLHRLMEYAREDIKAKREEVNAQQEAARKARQAAKAAAGAGSSNDPQAPEAPTTAAKELADRREMLRQYALQPPLPAAPMTDDELLEKHVQDLQYADAQLKQILDHNKKFAEEHRNNESEIGVQARFYQLKLIERELLVAREALRILQLTPLDDPAAISKKYKQIHELEFEESLLRD